MTDYSLLEARVGYGFVDKSRLESALTHRSWLNEQPPEARRDHNERLEFLGDAVLALIVGHLLMEAAPTATEGELSRRRAQLVSEASLAEVAVTLDLGEWLFLGRGEEQSGGRKRPSMLADAVEAVVGAVFLDGGFVAAADTVRHLFAARLAATDDTDWKTRLQEEAQRRKLRAVYTVLATSGPDHDKTFDVEVTVGDDRGRGQGRSKKEAEQRAAAALLALLGAKNDETAGGVVR
jgi:ribonuclease III